MNSREDFGQSGVIALFEIQVLQAPGATAFLSGSGTLSYEGIDCRAERVARLLRSRGIEQGQLAGVFLPRSSDLMTAILGVLKSGAAFLPLDPAYPRERLRFMIEDSGASLILSTRELVSALPECRVPVVLIDEEAGQPEREAELIPVRPPAPDDLAYVIYTSGSTGRPKGVAVEHRSLAALIDWSLGYFRREDFAGMLFSTSICFDVSVFEMFVPLCCGGSIIMVENALQAHRSPHAGAITFVNTGPSAMAELIRSGTVPRSARVIALAGETLHAGLAEACYRLPGIERVYNLYGPTEDTVYSTAYLVPRGAQDPVPIGRPIAGTRAYVLGDDLRPVSAGAKGQLYLAGAGLARGYLNRPELTAERFVPDPFADGPERMYATGDLCRIRPDGEIEFLGRIDLQVKLRGMRVEPGEIEAALLRHPAISEAVVVGRLSEAGEVSLVAYVAADPDPQPTVSDLRDHLAASLPSFMVPETFVVLDRLPRTPHGKLDRSSLPDPGSARPELRHAYQAPSNALDRLLAEVWSEALGVERVGTRDSFLDLGGHSLTAARVASTLTELLGFEVPIGCILENPTIAELSTRLVAAAPDAAALATALETDGRIPNMPDAEVKAWLAESDKNEG